MKQLNDDIFLLDDRDIKIIVSGLSSAKNNVNMK